MAEVYSVVKGQDIDRFIATLPVVQRSLDFHAAKIAHKAQMGLAAHRYTGNARIIITRGVIDRYVALDDTPMVKDPHPRRDGTEHLAALSIEYGRQGGGRWPPSAGLAILHTAAGLNIGRTFPRSKRRKRYRKGRR